MSDDLDLDTVRLVMSELGADCVLIGGWASYLHLRNTALSHDVDTILDPLSDKARVTSLIDGYPTHLGKVSGEIIGAHVDLYIPHISVVGDIPVERFLPYTARIDGIRVLIPEAHLLSKSACVLNDGRFDSDRAPKDTAEVRGMMALSDPESVAAIWRAVSKTPGDVPRRFAELMRRVQSDVTRAERKRGLDAMIREWNTAADAVFATAPPYLVPSSTVYVPHDSGVVARFHHRGGKPVTVQTLSDITWSDPRSVTAGRGKTLLTVTENTHPAARRIPTAITRDYAAATGACLVCGRALSDPASQERGYGPECAKLVR